MILTADNYYSLEADNHYMSCSLLQKFWECEAKACAYLRGEYVSEKTTALLVGNYVHSHFQSPEAKKRFMSENPDMCLKNGGLKSEYKQADKMIEALEQDEFCMYMLRGQKEVIVTAELFGMPWKVRFDNYCPGERFASDLKTTRSITDKDWVVRDGMNVKVSFIEAFDYMMRAAIYCEVERIAAGRAEGDWLNFYIVAVSKEDPPDKAVISLKDPTRYTAELERVKDSLMRIKLLKQGILQPIRCGRCDYCRSSKKVEGVINYRDL
jgi:hypothetical protein